jgi:hypothetical protein
MNIDHCLKITPKAALGWINSKGSVIPFSWSETRPNSRKKTNQRREHIYNFLKVLRAVLRLGHCPGGQMNVIELRPQSNPFLSLVRATHQMEKGGLFLLWT